MMQESLASSHAAPPSGRSALVSRLRGDGVELGALHAPLAIAHNKAIERIRYIDRYDKATLFALFPDLLAERDLIVEPDLCCDFSSGLTVLSNQSCDFVIAMHVIEHLPNPIFFLRELYRVLRPGGRLLLAAPDMRFTFDKLRPMTSLHLLEKKFQQKVMEVSDRELVAFARETCPSELPAAAGARTAFLAKLKERSIHVHVWNSSSFCQFLAHFCSKHRPFRLLQASLPEHNPDREILLLLEKPASGAVRQLCV